MESKFVEAMYTLMSEHLETIINSLPLSLLNRHSSFTAKS